MSSMRYLFIILLFIKLPVFSQLIINDTTTIYGERILDLGDVQNSKFCTIKQKDTVITYTPNQVKEYTLQDKRIYKSYPIQINLKNERFFLEQLFQGEKNLLYLSLDKGFKRFYVLKSDSSNILIEIPLIDYKNYLISVFKDCQTALENVEYVNYNKSSFYKFYNLYTQCTSKPLTRTRYGFSLIGINTQLNLKQLATFLYPDEKKNSLSFGAGFQVDVPISNTKFSFHPEVNYRQLSTNRKSFNGNTTNDLVINIAAISVPLQIRYGFYNQKISPYLQAGISYNRLLRNESNIPNYVLINNSQQMTVYDEPLFQKNMIGYNFGCGVLFNYSSKKSIFIELNLNQIRNFDFHSSLNSIDDIMLKLGVLI